MGEYLHHLEEILWEVVSRRHQLEFFNRVSCEVASPVSLACIGAPRGDDMPSSDEPHLPVMREPSSASCTAESLTLMREVESGQGIISVPFIGLAPGVWIESS